MGAVRLALALLICIMHAKAQGLIPKDFLPHVAGLTYDPKLSIFFMLAGFFARQAVLHLQGRSLFWPVRFWVSRAIRLWPVYWFCLAATYATVRMGYAVLPTQLMPGVPVWEAVLYNLVPFIPASLRVFELPVPWDSVIYALVVFQAWTLALIMVLFALAPLLFYGRLLYPFFLLSAAGLWHAYLQEGQHQGYVVIALPYFLAGGIAFDLYRRVRRVPEWLGLLAWCGAGVLVAALCWHGKLVQDYGADAANGFSVLLAFVLLPLLFAMTRNNRYDLYASNLSYPLYLVHFLVFYGLKSLHWGAEWNRISVIPLCILAAMSLHHALERPVMRYKKRSFVPGSGLKPP